jgi:uncharacterized MAPEG superfamily protein
MNTLDPILITCIGYASISLGLTFLLVGLRSWLTLSGQRAANSFAVDGSDVSPYAHRLCRAHANCYENAPIFGLIVIAAFASGRLELLNPLASVFLAARFAQSATHLVATNNAAVTLRALFLLIQLLIEVFWVFRLLFEA